MGTGFTFAIGGGAMLGIGLGAGIASGEFSASDKILMGVGGKVAVLGIILGGFSDLLFKKSVESYNTHGLYLQLKGKEWPITREGASGLDLAADG